MAIIVPVSDNFQSQVIELHQAGARVAVSVDPTMELKTPGRKEGRGEGEAAYYEKKKAQEDRNLTFEQRITEICHTVRVSHCRLQSRPFESNLVQVSKAAATDILDGVKLFSIIMAPQTARAVRLYILFEFRLLLIAVQTKEDNRKNNAQKQESINRGKQAAKSQNAVVVTMSAEHGPDFGGSAMTTT
jgi:hypothetical protein